MEYVVVKWLPVLSSTVLFGTGLGSAFYMLVISRTRVALGIIAFLALVAVF